MKLEAKVEIIVLGQSCAYSLEQLFDNAGTIYRVAWAIGMQRGGVKLFAQCRSGSQPE